MVATLAIHKRAAMRIITLTFLLATLPALAEHLPGGSITTRCLGGNQQQITLQLWRECTGAAMIAQGLTFSNDCGVQFTVASVPLISVENVSPVCPDQLDQTSCNGGPLIGIELYTYRLTTTLSACNAWTIAWNTCCRYPSVNLNGSPGLYIEARLNNAGNFCSDSPTFNDPVPPFVCVNQPASFDLGVTAPPALQLRYRLIDARRQVGVNPAVVEPVIYQPAYSGVEPFPGMAIDSITGNISFTPTLQGYIIAVVEVEYRDASGIWRGSVMRDFPFVAQVCANEVPDATSGTLSNAVGSGTITDNYAAATCGGSFCLEALIVDPDASQTLTLVSNIGQVIPGATLEVAGTNPATATICIDAAGLPVGTYTFTINATDNACPVVGSQTFTYTIVVQSGSASAGADASASICPGESIDLTTLLTGDPDGTWSAGPVVSLPGEYTYTITTSCGSDEAVFTITADQAPNPGSDAVVIICEGQQIDLTAYVTGDPGGTWSDGAPVVSAGGTYTYTVTNGCGSAAAQFVVNATVVNSAGLDNSISTCSLAPAFLLTDSLLGNPAIGGQWTGPAGLHGPVFEPSIDVQGVYCYEVLNPLPCPASQACLTITFFPDNDPECIWLSATELEAEVAISPNPSHGTLRIEGIRVQSADIIDAAGRLAWRSGQRGELTRIDLPASLPNGSYAIRIASIDGSMITRRFELLR
jgi:hypothetical protein